MQITQLGSIWFRATQCIALTWGSWRCRKVTLIHPPLNRPPQVSLGAFPFAVWIKWRGGIHKSTPQPRGKRNSKRRIPRMSSENRRLFTGANLVLRPALWFNDYVFKKIPFLSLEIYVTLSHMTPFRTLVRVCVPQLQSQRKLIPHLPMLFLIHNSSCLFVFLFVFLFVCVLL